MAAPVTSSEFTPASSVSVDVKPIAPKKSGFDPLRPVKRVLGFVDGTVHGTLDTMSNWGRKCSKIGAGVGFLLLIAGALPTGVGLLAIPIGWIMGLAGGAVTGGAVGLATGGIRGADREARKDKYAEDLLRKSQSKNLPTQRVDYRDAHREYKRRSDYNFDRILQQEREIKSDGQTYYQDLVHSSRGHNGHGKGF